MLRDMHWPMASISNEAPQSDHMLQRWRGMGRVAIATESVAVVLE